MLNLPAFGEKIRVWPLPGHKVQRLEEATITQGGTFLGEEGEEVVFSPHWYRRLLSGSIALVDPRPTKNDKGELVGGGVQPATREKHKHEWQPKKAAPAPELEPEKADAGDAPASAPKTLEDLGPGHVPVDGDPPPAHALPVDEPTHVDAPTKQAE